MVAVAAGCFPAQLPAVRLPPDHAGDAGGAAGDAAAASEGCSAVYGTVAGELGALRWVPAGPPADRLVTLQATLLPASARETLDRGEGSPAREAAEEVQLVDGNAMAGAWWRSSDAQRRAVASSDALSAATATLLGLD